MRLRALIALALAALTLPALALAQEAPAKTPPPEPAHFKLVYRLLQIGADGKIADARSYSTIIAVNGSGAPPSAIRSEDKIPIVTGTTSNPVNTEYQYQNVGIHIDTRSPQLFDRQLNLRVSTEFSQAVSGSSHSKELPAASKVLGAPVFRNVTWDSNVVVTLDKPTIIFTSDNVSDTGKTELELTATEIK